MPQFPRALIGVVAPVVLLSGCGLPARTAQPAKPASPTVAKQYFSDLAHADTRHVKRAVGNSASGSDAKVFATAVLQASEASVVSFVEGPYGSKVVRSGDSFKACYYAEGPYVCAPGRRSHVMAVNGKISTFTQGGEPIKDKVWPGRGVVADAGKLGSVELRSAYQDDFDQLVVTVRVRTKGLALEKGFVEARYLSPHGGPIGTSGPSASDTSIAPRSTTDAAIIFAYLDRGRDWYVVPGGEVVMTLKSTSGSSKHTIRFRIGG